MHPAARLGSADAPRWILLIHQIPPKPAYFRAKVGRRLARLGSVAIKNSVYALPRTSQSREDFQWLAREIVSDGGEATLCEASLIEGLRDEQVEALFLAARDADYSAVSEEARGVARTLPAKLARDDERRGQIENDVGRWEKRLAEIVTIDFFGAEGRETAEAAVLSVQKRLRQKEREPAAERPGGADASAYQGRTWTTRSNVGVDRIASAWLIKRFIDPGAVFSVVAAQGRPPAVGEISVDVFEATFTHVGERCTFEARPVWEYNESCRVALRCGGRMLYGAGEAGYLECAQRAGRPVGALDERISSEGGDPRLTWSGNRVTVSDFGESGAWSLDVGL